MQYKKLKVKSIKSLGSTKVRDLTVESAQHYISSNGVVNHNTGPEYAASIILFLGKAKLSEGNATGIIVTAKPNKNRFAKPTPVKFWIDFNKGMNPYVGLQDYISWDNCGIQRGKFINQKDYEKLSPSDKENCREHTYNTDKGEVTVYFQPSETARGLAVRHLNDVIKLTDLFTPEVLDPVLKEMDEKVINGIFQYGDSEDIESEIDDIINSTEEIDSENE